MNKLYQSALDGTLRSSADPARVTMEIHNNTEVMIWIVWVDHSGYHKKYFTLNPGAKRKQVSSVGDAWMALNALSGGFICAFRGADAKVVTQGHDPVFVVSCDLLVPPGDIGKFPAASEDMPIPPDSPLVMVACGKLSNGHFITREQYWARQPDSFSLAPKEKKTATLTTTRGLQSTSSDQKTLESSLNISANAGWGPISAGISSGLSASATTFQQVTVTEETAIYESKYFESKSEKPIVFLIWQLTDVVTIYSSKHLPLATMSMGEPPSLFSDQYNPAELAPRLADAPHDLELPVPTLTEVRAAPRSRKPVPARRRGRK